MKQSFTIGLCATVIFLLLSSVTFAQRKGQSFIDSLQAALPGKAEDTGKVMMLSYISFTYQHIDPEEGIDYGKQAVHLSQKINWKRGVAVAYNCLGVNYWAQADYPNAEKYYLASLKINKELKNNTAIAGNLSNFGIFYFAQGEYEKAIDYELKALRVCEGLKDNSCIANNLGNIGNIYKELKDYTRSIEYDSRALKIYEELGDKVGIARNLGNIGSGFAKQENKEKALEYFKRALKIFEELGNKQGIAIYSGNIGSIYDNSETRVKSLEYYMRSLNVYKEIGYKTGLAMALDRIGQLYLNIAIRTDLPIPLDTLIPKDRESVLNKAAEYLNAALEITKETGDLNTTKLVLSMISRTKEEQRNYAEALDYYKQSIIYKDSVFNDEHSKEITRHELQYEFSKQQDSLNFINQLTRERLQKQTLLGRQQTQALLLSNKEKDLQHLLFLKTQADLQTEALMTREKQRQLNQAQNEKALQKAQLYTLGQDRQLGKLRLRQQWLYSIAAFALLAMGAFYFFSRNRIQQLKLKGELANEKAGQQLKETAYKARMNDMAFTALRAQMNPHFIFNCLNSIKLYTEQNNSEAASRYLSGFARLIRHMLDNARTESILLSTELESLRLYLDMEAMRFKEKLHYNIVVDKEVDTEFIEIPPLLIQPYVENAIWHGLMHKAEGGTVTIHLSQSPAPSMLIITVEDNGIGRQKSAGLKQQEAVMHQSLGTKLTNERIELINEKYRSNAEVLIEDLADNGHQPLGTLVTIKLPIK